MKCVGKNLKSKPANRIYNKNNLQEYRICNDCLKTEVIQTLLDKEEWKVILDTPTLKEELEGETK